LRKLIENRESHMKQSSRRTGAIACVAGVCALGATVLAQATEILSLKKVISVGTITSFDIGFVDTTLNFYLLADRTNNAVDVIDTNSNTLVLVAGPGAFAGAAAGGTSVSGPNGVMTVHSREIWASDGDGSIKFLSMATGGVLGQVVTADRQKALNPLAPVTRADEMCFDPVDNVGFVAVPGDGAAATAPLIVRISGRTHQISGQLNFDGLGGGGNGITVFSQGGLEQCQFNPRNNHIYVVVDSDAAGGTSPGGAGQVAVAEFDPVTLQFISVLDITPLACAGGAGLAIGPVIGGTFGSIAVGCGGPDPTAGALRSAVIVDDGTTSGATFVPGTRTACSFPTTCVVLPNQAGADEIAFNGIVTAAGTSCPAGAPGVPDCHYYFAKGNGNSPGNTTPFPGAIVTGGGVFPVAVIPAGPDAGKTPQCPAALQSTLPNGVYGSQDFTAGNTLGHYAAVNGRSPSDFTAAASVSPNGGATVGAGPGSVGMINAFTLENDPDVNVNLFNCTPTSPGAGGTSNIHGGSHSVAADPIHNQIYVPIASTAWKAPATGVCSGRLSNGSPAGGNDLAGCIAVFAPSGSDP
jgi:hypothetical protein